MLVLASPRLGAGSLTLSVQVCGFTTLWEKAGARIQYDRLLVDYTNSEMPGGGDGSLNIENGLFTCLSPGWYKVGPRKG